MVHKCRGQRLFALTDKWIPRVVHTIKPGAGLHPRNYIFSVRFQCSSQKFRTFNLRSAWNQRSGFVKLFLQWPINHFQNPLLNVPCNNTMCGPFAIQFQEHSREKYYSNSAMTLFAITRQNSVYIKMEIYILETKQNDPS